MTGVIIHKPYGTAAAGAVVGEVSIDNHTFTGPTKAAFGVSNVGLVYGTQNSDAVSIAESWIEPQSGMSQFSVMVHQESGNALNDINAGLDVWLQLNVHRWWGYYSTSGTLTGVFTVSIKRNSDGAIMDTATFTLTTPGDSGGETTNPPGPPPGEGGGGIGDTPSVNLN